MLQRQSLAILLGIGIKAALWEGGSRLTADWDLAEAEGVSVVFMTLEALSRMQ